NPVDLLQLSLGKGKAFDHGIEAAGKVTDLVLARGIGAAAQITDFDDGDQDEDFATIFTSELSLDFPRDIDLDFDYKLQLVATDLGKTSHHTAGILSFELWDPLDLDVGAYWDRIEQPEKDNDGERPKRDDFRLTVGLSLDF
ncbi:MAG: DUF481 domain-containing protein, partial [Deltaproteobacteria bacterium]|nr:DUF481 domain-containing protein [Deltaproteobacteria bacterium]